MQISHEILEFNTTTGSMRVRYYNDETPDSLVYNIDIPIENGAFVDMPEIEKLIKIYCPTEQLKRVSKLKIATVPSSLMPYVPVQSSQTPGLVVTPAAYGDKYFTPTLGQAGKDVIWYPTPSRAIEVMLEIANVNANDIVYELGSGTGYISIEAAKLGATAVGIEYNPVFVNLANRKAEAAGVTDKVTFTRGDFFTADFSSATVVMLYLSPEINLRLKPKLQAMPVGTRIVSFTFDIGGWLPSKVLPVGDTNVYEWTVGA
jgi:phospholipid N-methyltransferase